MSDVAYAVDSRQTHSIEQYVYWSTLAEIELNYRCSKLGECRTYVKTKIKRLHMHYSETYIKTENKVQILWLQ